MNPIRSCCAWPLAIFLLQGSCDGEGEVCTARLQVRLPDPDPRGDADRAWIRINGQGADRSYTLPLSGDVVEIPDTGEIHPADGFGLVLAAYDSSTQTIRAVGRTALFGCLDHDEHQIDLYLGPANGFAPVAGGPAAAIAFTATPLLDGRVLLFGNAEPPVWIFDQGAGELCGLDQSCFPAQPQGILSAREGHTATRTEDGSVLIIGGRRPGTSTLVADVLRFDPASMKFQKLPDLAVQRIGHAAVWLDRKYTTGPQAGNILLVGGLGEDAQPVAGALLIDPASGQSLPDEPALITPRAYATATLLESGEVLIAGGRAQAEPLDSAEIFTSGGSFAALGRTCSGTSSSLCARRTDHTATLLDDGSVLLWGGEIEPASGATGAAPPVEVFVAAGQPQFMRLDTEPQGTWAGHTAVRIMCSAPPCPVLIAGGNGTSGIFSYKSLQVSAGTFAPLEATPLANRSGHAAAPLDDGPVLLFGGQQSGLAAGALFSLCETLAGMPNLSCP